MSDTYMLDTDIASYIIKSSDEALISKLDSVPQDSLSISCIVASKLHYWIANRPRIGAQIHKFLSMVDIQPFDQDDAIIYGDVRRQLQVDGTPIGANDMLIAAHALSRGSILVTNNIKHFQYVKGLKVENWVK